MPCGIAIIRWGECKHSMLLKVGCTANCGDDEMCGPEDQQTMVRTLFRWLCEECHTRRAAADEEARAKGWDARAEEVQAIAELTPAECDQRVWMLRSRENWEDRHEEAKSVAQAEDILFAADWTYEYGLAAYEIRHGAAQEKPVEEKPAEGKPAEEKPVEGKPMEEKPAKEKLAEKDETQPQARDRQDAGPAPSPGLEAEPQQSKGQQFMVTQKLKGAQQSEAPQKLKGKSQFKAPPKPEDGAQFKAPQKPKKWSQFKVPQKPEKQQQPEEQPEEKQPHDGKAPQRRRPEVNRDDAPQDRILKLRAMQPWDLHVMLDVLRTKEELLEALAEQKRRGAQTTTTRYRTRNDTPSTPQA